MGWHPCLTLDRPVLPPERVPSLVSPNGAFWPLGELMKRLILRNVAAKEIKAEFDAQYQRFVELVGQAPTAVNTHHHVQVFPPVGRVLLDVLAKHGALPYVRRIRESWPTVAAIRGARSKRLALSLLGRWYARRQFRAGFPGNDWLAGITDPRYVANPDFLVRWLARIPGTVVELTCHPGYSDATLLGRDATVTDGQMQRRVHELQLLRRPSFRSACENAGFTLISPSALSDLCSAREAHAA
jgi:predicted glycoside hydrolase/deacetylase ChbG (UPF0249 family)